MYPESFVVLACVQRLTCVLGDGERFDDRGNRLSQALDAVPEDAAIPYLSFSVCLCLDVV